MKKQEEATRIVVNFIAAQITPIKLDVDDVRLLRWQIQEPRYESIIASMRLSKIRAWPKFHNKKKSDEPLNYTDPDSNPADVPDTVKE
jgi:hypothetical protein